MEALGEFIKVRAKVEPISPSHPRAERLWAKPLGGNRAEIGSIPFFTREVTLNDIVEYDERGDITRVVASSGGVTIAASYPATREAYTKLYRHLEEKGCKVEGAAPGWLTAWVPPTLPVSEFVAIVRDHDGDIMDDMDKALAAQEHYLKNGCASCGEKPVVH